MDIQMTERAHQLLSQLKSTRKPTTKNQYRLHFSAVNYVDYAVTPQRTCHVSRFSACDDVLIAPSSPFVAFCHDYLDTYAPAWANGHGSLGSFTFDTMVNTIRLELNLLGVVQTSTTYPIGKED